MVSEEQLKIVEYLATGHTIPQASLEVGVSPETVRGWLKNNPEVVKELSTATDVFQRECLKSRSRAYRQMTKQITDSILLKMEDGDLKTYSVDDLIKMLNKTVATMKEDENSSKSNNLIGNQTNIQINATIQDKLNDKNFASKFGDLLLDLDPEDIQNVVEAKQKSDREAEFRK